MEKEYLVVVDLGVVVKAKDETEAKTIVEARFKGAMGIREEPITGVSIHGVEIEKRY